MKQVTKIVSIEKTRKKKAKPSLEYELMASLCFEQYGSKNGADFEKLLDIPAEDRIDTLMKEFGVMNMHRLVRTMLQEFSLRLGLPESRKLSVTAMSVCACDIMLAAEEDQLAMEDLVIFFQLAGDGRYGKFKGLLTHYDIMAKLEEYRKERKIYYESHEQKTDSKLAASEVIYLPDASARICHEPTRIGELMDRAPARVIAMKANSRERS